MGRTPTVTRRLAVLAESTFWLFETPEVAATSTTGDLPVLAGVSVP